MRAAALRYALAPTCIALAALLHLSPAGPFLHPTGLFVFAVVGAAWFGGAGPGLFAAVLATFALPQLIAMSYALVAGVFDLPRFITFSVAGLAVGWWGFRRRQVEAALRNSEQRYALAMEAAGDGHLDWDLVSGEFYISSRLLEIVGYPPDASFADRADWVRRFPFHPEDRPKWEAAVAAHFAGRESHFKMELRIVVRGEVRWTAFHFLSMRDSAGTPIRWTGSIGDITGQKRVELTLAESEARFRSLTALSSDWYWVQDENLRFTYLSSQAGDQSGYAGELALGKTRWEIPNTMPLSGSWAEHQAVLAARQPFRDLECSRIAPDGTLLYISINGEPLFDEQGRFRGYHGTGRNITERKRIEEALRESEQRYELAMAASESGYWDWDIATGRYFTSPRAFELAGYPPGHKWATRDEFKAGINMHPADFARWEAAREALFAGTGERLSMELRYIVRGETRWHMLHAICRRDDAGKVIRWIGSATDVTERKRAEEELRAMERKLRQAQRLETMGTFAGGIAHDFNNILGAILGYGEMALRGAPKGSRLARDLDTILTAGERGRALVGRLLTFSRSVVGERVPVHVERVAREALDVVSAKLPPGVTVHARLHAGRAAILGDATQVHQVVTNLATNAIQAMPAGGTLRVELANVRVEAPRAAKLGGLAVGEYVVLTVADSGAGIAPEIMERIFDPFFTTKEVGTGTGLGLSLVHGIATELGGGIDVITKVGAGTTFTVYLPRSGEAPEAEDDAELALPRGEGQRVLVLDDEEPLVRLATRTLEELGYAPIGFTSSSAALAALRADPQRFDALITDERMPGVSGSALIREVRGIRSAMPVVLMSGYLGPTADKVRESGLFQTLGMSQKIAAAIGADEVLQKPLSARDLATSLARVLRL